MWSLVVINVTGFRLASGGATLWLWWRYDISGTPYLRMPVTD
jgi:hypothetical protein